MPIVYLFKLVSVLYYLITSSLLGVRLSIFLSKTITFLPKQDKKMAMTTMKQNGGEKNRNRYRNKTKQLHNSIIIFIWRLW